MGSSAAKPDDMLMLQEEPGEVEEKPYIRYPCSEPVDCYEIGGFHPVNLDDILNNRYQVFNKLGYGSYGTVWLVEDLTSGKLASIKILASNISKNVSELAILRHIEKSKESSAHDGHQFIVKFLDEFKIDGPNGVSSQRCLDPG